MTQTVDDLERDIEATRARLDRTIDHLQDRLSVSGIVDELMGSVRASDRFGAMFDHALAVVRRNPVPVILVAAGVGWLIQRLGRDNAMLPLRRGRVLEAGGEGDVPVMNDGNVHLYDPDVSPRHPTHDHHERRREMHARA